MGGKYAGLGLGDPAINLGDEAEPDDLEFSQLALSHQLLESRVRGIHARYDQPCSLSPQ